MKRFSRMLSRPLARAIGGTNNKKVCTRPVQASRTSMSRVKSTGSRAAFAYRNSQGYSPVRSKDVGCITHTPRKVKKREALRTQTIH